MQTIQKWKEECRMRNIKRLSDRFTDKNYIKGGAIVVDYPDDDDDDDDDDVDDDDDDNYDNYDDDDDDEEQNPNRIPGIFSILRQREIGIGVGSDIRNRNRRRHYINRNLLRPNPANQAYQENIQNNNRNRFLEIPIGEIEEQKDQNDQNPQQRRRFNQ